MQAAEIQCSQEGLVQQFIEAMRRQMEKKAVSHAQLAERTGLSRQYVYKLLSGEHNVTLETAQKVADALDIQITVKAGGKKIA